MRQILDLDGVWSQHDHFFISENTALSRSIAAEHCTFFVSHVAFGQARLGSPGRMILSGARNFIQAAKIIWRERPDVLISTGAGSMFFPVLWARLAGSKIVIIESFARFNRPSLFAKLAAPLAHLRVVQSAALTGFFRRAVVFDPLRQLDSPRQVKRSLLFVTVGATLPFDRMVRMVADLKARGEIPESVLIQTGTGGVAPPGVETVENLPFDQVTAVLREADIVVCHGGTGSLITALREGCRVVAVPRLFDKGEHYDDHQSEITAAFAARGLISVANSEAELAEALRTARARTPVHATTDHTALVEYLNGAIEAWRSANR